MNTVKMLESATADQIDQIRAILGMESEQPEAVTLVKALANGSTVKDGKVRCKVCGFHKKPRKVLVETGICGVCTEAVKDGSPDSVEVVGRMGKRGRNSVSVVIDGKRYKVKRLSSKHSERVAAKHASKPKGYAKRAKRTGSEPKGLPTDSRIGADREQRTPDA